MLSLLKRITTIFLLTAYVVSGTSVLPAIVSMVASLDDSHSVAVAQSGSGMQVILHHRSKQFTPKLEDHETPLARMIVSMCESADSGDHQLSIGEITARLNLTNESDNRIAKVPRLNFQETQVLIQEMRSFEPIRIQIQPAPSLRGSRSEWFTVRATVQLLI